MKKQWILKNDKFIMNFTNHYLNSKEEVLNSNGFKSILSEYLNFAKNKRYKSFFRLKKILDENDFNKLIERTIKLLKLLIIMDSKQVSRDFLEFSQVYPNKDELRAFIEDVYTYWRNLERYVVVEDKTNNYGILNANFIDAKEAFNKLVIGLYRTISNNLSLTTPTVYRQVSAGSNAGFISYKKRWDIPKDYMGLNKIFFIKEVVLDSPFITYPKKNTRDGVFIELTENPLNRVDLKKGNYFCYPIMVGNLLAFIYVESTFITHGISLANLFELPKESFINNKNPDLLVIFGGYDKLNEKITGFYDDRENNLVVGYVSNHPDHDYFGYMKKMILTIHNIHSLNNKSLPIHGAMVAIELKDGSKSNIVIVGDSGAGKSESIEAFRALASDYISDMKIIFDDMGRFSKKNNRIWGYGTETGAFVRLDDLETGFAFKELDRSIFMNPDKINARLITPISSYNDILTGRPVDILLYANNYSRVKEGETAIKIFKNPDRAKEVFLRGKRMAKGTTTEEGLTESFFANPFGPHQRSMQTSELIDDFFKVLFDQNIPVGLIYTQLGIPGLEKKGPKIAAKDLFDLVKTLAGGVNNENIEKG